MSLITRRKLCSIAHLGLLCPPVFHSSGNCMHVTNMYHFLSLDGVAEVSYIHSNQNVVGSSKAENHMSRWAVRDVFELKQFSQLPANIATHILEVRITVIYPGTI